MIWDRLLVIVFFLQSDSGLSSMSLARPLEEGEVSLSESLVSIVGFFQHECCYGKG